MPPDIAQENVPEDDGDDIQSVSSHTFSERMIKTLPQRPKITRAGSKRDTEPSDIDTDASSENDSDSAPEEYERPKKVLRRSLSHVEITEQAHPRSAYEGWVPPLERSSEASAIAELKAAHDAAYVNSDKPSDYTYFTLDDFSVYNPHHSRHSHELATLDRLQNRGGYYEFLFDGILRVGDTTRFVQGVRFQVIAVDGYGEPDVISLKDRICIQSPRARAADIWYQLGKPSKDYERFYTPFLWLAQFTKYFVDYLLATPTVTLHHFRHEFSTWLVERYGQAADFQTWFNQCNRLPEFRTTVVAHYGYLWKECFSIDDRQTGLCKHSVWGETNPFGLDAIPEQPNREQKTIVTPFVYNCFRRMYFHEHLEARGAINEAVLKNIVLRKASLGLTPYGASQAPEANIPTPQSAGQGSDDNPFDVRIGDVVCVTPDTGGAWRVISFKWFAYVQNVRHEPSRTLLDVIWLYEPHDTTFGRAFYPFQNELFMSDNCGCGNGAVDLEQVIGKADVTWFAKDPSEQSGLFVRQKFRTIKDEDTYDFVSLKESDFRCECSKADIFEECRRKYQIGDTVLVRHWNWELREDSLEPCQIVDFKLDSRRVDLKRFQRGQQINKNAPPNELLLPKETLTKRPSAIIRKCQIQFFTSKQVQEGLPTPYDRHGTGDFFFIHWENNYASVPSADTDDEIRIEADGKAADDDHLTIETASDPMLPSELKKLKGLGIFCGGGNFDRGLEDGGAVEFRYAVDWDSRAIHSYRANVDDPAKLHFYLGSVNDYLARAIDGSSCKDIACIGTIDCISAGSPCPGFSTLQLNKQSFQSLRNASMVASVVSYVDFYCPKYLVLENVVSMTHGMGAMKDENVFAQVLAALVALGYQTQQFLMDAWNYGSSQSRSRVFIIASAPGLEPLAHPQHSHGHPLDMFEKSLGKSSNGLRFGIRRDDFTPFQHVSPLQATADLPPIGNGQLQLCPEFPDHRVHAEENPESKARIAAVLVRPHGMGLAQVAYKGRLSGSPLEWFERQNAIRGRRESKSYARVFPHGLFPTVTTSLNVQCGISGRTLHWNENRPLTIMELKRAQGFLDHDVIIGSPRHQVKIIGNSVERNVALALGLSLRASWATIQPVVLSPSASGDSWHSAIESQADDPIATGSGTTDRNSNQQSGHLYTLSQEEKRDILADPVHGFRKINEIFRERRESSQSHSGTGRGIRLGDADELEVWSGSE